MEIKNEIPETSSIEDFELCEETDIEILIYVDEATS